MGLVNLLTEGDCMCLPAQENHEGSDTINKGDST